MSDIKVVEIRKEEFNTDGVARIPRNRFTNDLWPLVYILTNRKQREAYIGETTDVLSRMSSHLKSSKRDLTTMHLITSSKFNKSATLDIESNLIRYMSGDAQFKLRNANVGIANHTYFEKEEYWNVFQEIWNQLISEGISVKSLKEIDNSDFFKYSPYKALSKDQRNSVIEIIESLVDDQTKSIIVEGGAGSGKTIVALYLFKLLNTEIADFNLKEFAEEELRFITLVQKLKAKYPEPRIALVVPMASFRATLKKVFKNIRGLTAKMVIGPAEIADNRYDILIVDESHRLRRRVNLGAYFGSFDKAAEKMGFDKMKTNELQWIRERSDKQILFYDKYQSIKPSDIEQHVFSELKAAPTSNVLELVSQFRVKGGLDYVQFIFKLLNCSLPNNKTFSSPDYEFQLIDDINEFQRLIAAKNAEVTLSRLIAGYSWKWISKKSKKAFDIEIDGVKFRWNSVAKDWVNSPNAHEEVGCIHTTQGYDLNYAGIIFGNEIGYDGSSRSIIIRPKNYFDENGKRSIKDPAHLKDYILNIYMTMMLRGIKGTYVYVCDPELREYFRQHILSASAKQELKIVHWQDAIPFVNAVPCYNFKVAAGLFSHNQEVSDFEWAALPDGYRYSDDYFICKVEGESMNKFIPNGSWCLFRKDSGGSRNGKIVLVQHHDIADPDFGFGFTVKQYYSEKIASSDSWRHQSITLKPNSTESIYEDIALTVTETDQLKVVGVFVAVL